MPFGSDNPYVVLPLSEASYLVLTRDFITNVDNPAPGVLGRYGLGYAFIKEPTLASRLGDQGSSMLPLKSSILRCMTTGRSVSRWRLSSIGPEKLLNISLNPINMGFTLADLMTFGLTSRFSASMQAGLKQLPLSGGNIDPVYAFIWLANALSGGQAAQQLCLSREELDKSVLVKHFMQHYQAIAGALHTWRQIPDWLAGDGTCLSGLSRE